MFGHPRLFHLGMDEETTEHQSGYNYLVVRQGDQWWYDFNKFTAAVEKNGARPWIWSDYIWNHSEDFLARMSKEIVQSNWYYSSFTEPRESAHFTFYDLLSEKGYDQIPTGSNWSCPDNFSGTVKYCIEHISEEHLLGFMQTVWHATLPKWSDINDAAVRELKIGVDIYNKMKK